jgi:hypothetical protein
MLTELPLLGPIWMGSLSDTVAGPGPPGDGGEARCQLRPPQERPVPGIDMDASRGSQPISTHATEAPSEVQGLIS